MKLLHKARIEVTIEEEEESESDDEGGKMLMLSGEGGDFSYCFDGEDSMHRPGAGNTFSF